jgi:YHS domain-containing protein
MSDVSELQARIDAAFTAAKDKVKQQAQSLLHDEMDRQKRMTDYEQVQARIVEIAKPRLEALAKRSGDRVAVTPSVVGSRRSATFDFKSPKALISLKFSVAPDRDIKNAVVDYDLRIIPILWRFESHYEFSSPIASLDADGVARWLDDRIIGFVELFIQIHEGMLFDRAETVEDPVAKVTFPKFAAGATLEKAGQTYYFIDETTKNEFMKKQGAATK